MADEKNYRAVQRQEHHRNTSSPTSTVDAESANPLKGENVAAKDDVERAGPNTAASWWRYLNEDVDTAQTTSQLALYCFMTGYIGVISFSAIFVWCGFQKGNFAQLAIALARLFYGPSASRDTSFHKADQQALTSLISFNAGAFIGRIGDRVGAHKRIWLIAGTLFIGSFVSRAILQKIGTAGTLGVAVGIKILSCFTWLFVPTKRGQKRNTPAE